MQFEPLYRPILKKSFRVIWRHRFLWFFGLFAALLGTSGEIEILIGGAGQVDWGVTMSDILRQVFKGEGFGRMLKELLARMAQVPNAGWLVFLALGLGLAVVVWLYIVSQIALIDTTARLANREATNSKVRHLVARRYFWKILGLNAVSRGIIYGLLLAIGLPMAISLHQDESRLYSTSLLIISYIILVPLAMIASFIVRYASCYIILKRADFWQGIKEGGRLFIKNWLVSVEMAIIIFGLNILAGLLMTLAGVVISFPFMVGVEILVDLNSAGGSWAALMAGLILVLGVIAFFGALFVAFTYSAWTLLFLELSSGGRKLSRLVRWVAGTRRVKS